MSKQARILTVVLLSFISAAALAQPPQPPKDTIETPTLQDSYSVIYTGHLFGYYRMPEVQTVKTLSCNPAMPIDAQTPEAAAFYDKLQKAHSQKFGTEVRVAMGDNFAPFLLAREMWKDADHDHDWDPQKGPKWDESHPLGTLVAKSGIEWVPGKGKWLLEEKAQADRAAYGTILGGQQTIPMDNVGCFLRRMGFDAIVPGEHDFYFGPERLRELAVFLKPSLYGSPAERAAGPNPNLAETQLLGVNLTLDTREVKQSASAATPGKRGPLDPEELPYSAHPLPDKAKPPSVTVTPPKTPLPWMRTIRIKIDLKKFANDPKVCIEGVARMKADLGKLPWKGAPGLLGRICENSLHPRWYALTKSGDMDSEGYTSWTIEGDLKWDTDYAVAVVYDGPQRGAATLQPILVAWQTFRIAPSYFEYGRQAPELKRPEPQQKPWFYKPPSVPGELGVAVFGVVDANLAQLIGRLNYVWLDKKRGAGDPKVDDRFETDVQVSDPADALKQAIEYCQADNQCKDARKVLLAQMPEASVYDVLASLKALGSKSTFKFDLVIVQADQDHAAGSRTIIRNHDLDPEDLPGNVDVRTDFDEPFVLVPGYGAITPPEGLVVPPGSEPRDASFVRLQQAIVTDGQTQRALRNQVFQNSWNEGVPTNWFAGPVRNLKSPTGNSLLAYLQAMRSGASPVVADTALETLGGIDKEVTDAKTWSTGLQQLALKQMMKSCNADLAMLQKRDVYVPRVLRQSDFKLTADGRDAALRAIFWKGDYVQCINVPGSALKSTLTASTGFQQDQTLGLLTEDSLSWNWSLATLGAGEGGDPARQLVGGMLLDPQRLYSIATTDFLANGDTGYSGLQSAEPPPLTSWSHVHMAQVAKVVSGRFDTDSASEGLDALERPHPPIIPNPLHTPNTVLRDWVKGLLPTNDGKKLTPLELSAQQRPLWSISLYKADFSYSLGYHNGTEADIANRYPGVSAVDLTATDSASFAVDYMARVQRDAPGWFFYGQSELNYGYKKTRSSSVYPTFFYDPSGVLHVTNISDPYSRSQTANFFYNEVGLAHHLRPPYRNPTAWKVQIPLGFQSQISPSLAAPNGISTNVSSGGKTQATAPPPPVKSPITYYLSLRPGLRYDFSFSKPADWSLSQASAPTASAGGTSSGGGGGKKGKRGGSSSASTGAGGQAPGASGSASASGGGAGQSQTFDSFVEFGYEAGPQFGPRDFVLSDPGDKVSGMPYLESPYNPLYTPRSALPNLQAIQCNPQYYNSTTKTWTVPAQAVTNCFLLAGTPADTSTASPQNNVTLTGIDAGRTHFQNGAYFNYRLDVPLPVAGQFRTFSNMEFISELHSDFFFGHRLDTPIDTHFLVDAKQSLNIPLFPLFSGKVSLAPTLEMIFYTNKITNNIYRSYTTSVALNYTLDWHKGLNWKKVPGYSNPVPTLPTLPTR